jgi:hypothetical protein
MEVNVVLEQAATAFERCLQALKSGGGPTARQPRQTRADLRLDGADA